MAGNKNPLREAFCALEARYMQTTSEAERAEILQRMYAVLAEAEGVNIVKGGKTGGSPWERPLLANAQGDILEIRPPGQGKDGFSLVRITTFKMQLE